MTARFPSILPVVAAVLALTGTFARAADVDVHTGRIVSISPTKLVMVDNNDASRIFGVLPETKFKLAGQDALPLDLKPGMKIKASTRQGGNAVLQIEAEHGHFEN